MSWWCYIIICIQGKNSSDEEDLNDVPDDDEYDSDDSFIDDAELVSYASFAFHMCSFVEFHLPFIFTSNPYLPSFSSSGRLFPGWLFSCKAWWILCQPWEVRAHVSFFIRLFCFSHYGPFHLKLLLHSFDRLLYFDHILLAWPVI